MLDVTAFSNALLTGTVSYVRPLGVGVMTDRAGRVRVLIGEDAAVYPLGSGDSPKYALRVPLRADGAWSWPERYADLQSVSGGIRRFLPQELTVLDSDLPGEPHLALLYRWIPGESLIDRLRRGANGDELDAIVVELAELSDALRESRLIHGDIAPGNVIVQPDMTLGLIDLDRMGLSHHSGITPRRRPGYRLPDASASPEAEDAFGLLVLMASVAAYRGLAQLPAERESERGLHPPLLFSSWDLMDPSRSELVRRLERELTGIPALLLKYLIGACASTSDHVPAILGEAVHEVQRAPQHRRPRPDAGAGAATWNTAEAQPKAEYETWRLPERPQHDSWPSLGIEEPLDAWAVATPAAPDTDDVLERIAQLASLEVTNGGGRGRQRLRAEHRRSLVGRELRAALDSNSREVLVRLAMSGDIAELGDSDRSDLVMVLRALSYDQIARAVASDRDESIIAAVDPQIFPSDTDVDQAFRARVRLARERDAWVTQVIEAVRHENKKRCADLLAGVPDGGLDRLPTAIRDRAHKMIEISMLAVAIQRGLAQEDLNAIVGPMARLSALTGQWSAHVDASDVVSAIGYPRIRQRVIDRLTAGSLTGEDQWLIDCVVAAGDLDDVARDAGKCRDELRFLLAPRGKRRATGGIRYTESRAVE